MVQVCGRMGIGILWWLWAVVSVAHGASPDVICGAQGYDRSGSYKAVFYECLAYATADDRALCKRAGDHEALCTELYRHLGKPNQQSRCKPWAEDAELGPWCQALALRGAARCTRLEDTLERRHCAYLVGALLRLDADSSAEEPSPVTRGVSTPTPTLPPDTDTDEEFFDARSTFSDASVEALERVAVEASVELDPRLLEDPEAVFELAEEVEDQRVRAERHRVLLLATSEDPRLALMFKGHFDTAERKGFGATVGDPAFLLKTATDALPLVGPAKKIRDGLKTASASSARQNTHEFLADTLTDPEVYGALYPTFASVAGGDGPSPLVLAALATLGGHHRVEKWVERAKVAWGTVSLALSAAKLAGYDVGPTTVGAAAADGMKSLVKLMAGDTVATETVLALVGKTTKGPVDAIANEVAGAALLVGAESLLTARQEDAMSVSVHARAEAAGLHLSDEQLDAATENLVQYMKTRALLAYLGPARETFDDPVQAAREDARVELKRQFGSVSTEHLGKFDVHSVTLPVVGSDGSTTGYETVLTGMSQEEFIWYHYVASKRADKATHNPPWLVDLMAVAQRPSPLKIMWQSERIWETLSAGWDVDALREARALGLH